MLKTTLTVAAAFLLLWAGTAWSQPSAPTAAPSPVWEACWGMGSGPGPHPAWGGGEPRPNPGRECLAGLDLSDKQKQQIAKLKRDHHRKMVELGSKMAGMRGKIKLMITGEDFKQSDLNELCQNIGKFHERMVQMRVNHMRQIRNLLTDEQKVIFDQRVLSRPGPGGPMMMGDRPGARGHREPCKPHSSRIKRAW